MTLIRNPSRMKTMNNDNHDAEIERLAESIRSLKDFDFPENDGAVKRFNEIEKEFYEYSKNSTLQSYSLGSWIPSLGKYVRPLVPGELVTIIADTGVGKTAVLQNIALSAHPLKTLIFEIELPETLMFERFISMSQKIPGWKVLKMFQDGIPPDWKSDERLGNIMVCSNARITVEDMEKRIVSLKEKSNPPDVVIVDYIGLIQAKGISRYERMSWIAEQLKILAKKTKTIIICACQIHRKPEDSEGVGLHDAKDSGSIENSSGLVLGLWRTGLGGKNMKVKILKNTKGWAGLTIDCNFDGETLLIHESYTNG